MEYELVYDAASAFAGWETIAIFVPICVFLFIAVFKKNLIPSIFIFQQYLAKETGGFTAALVTIVIFLMVLVSGNIIYENIKLGSLSKNNECLQIAGIVTNFEPVPIRGSLEKFKLHDTKFQYYTHDFLDPGFNQSAADGGPIYEGAKIRICYIEQLKNRKKSKKIIRVETAFEAFEK